MSVHDAVGRTTHFEPDRALNPARASRRRCTAASLREVGIGRVTPLPGRYTPPPVPPPEPGTKTRAGARADARAGAGARAAAAARALRDAVGGPERPSIAPSESSPPAVRASSPECSPARSARSSSFDLGASSFGGFSTGTVILSLPGNSALPRRLLHLVAAAAAAAARTRLRSSQHESAYRPRHVAAEPIACSRRDPSAVRDQEDDAAPAARTTATKRRHAAASAAARTEKSTRGRAPSSAPERCPADALTRECCRRGSLPWAAEVWPVEVLSRTWSAGCNCKSASQDCVNIWRLSAKTVRERDDRRSDVTSRT